MMEGEKCLMAAAMHSALTSQGSQVIGVYAVWHYGSQQDEGDRHARRSV